MMIADKDLVSIQQARIMIENAFEAQKRLAAFSQEELDAVAEGMVRAVEPHLRSLAAMSHEETGCGRPQDKLAKNRFVCRRLFGALRGMRCVGVLEDDPIGRVREIGVPLGVIAALCPATSPVSTTIYKALLAVKSANAVVFSPHPRAAHSMRRVLDIMIAAAHKHGLPEGCLAYLDVVTKSGTEELMRHPLTALVTATGVRGMLGAVRASGKPLIYGGGGNGPAFIERTADISRAARDIIRSKTFDNGIVPSGEQSIVVDAAVAPQVRKSLQDNGAYFMSDEESHRLAAVLFTPDNRRRKDTIGLCAATLAAKAGLTVPGDAQLLIAERKYVRPGADPYTGELLAPVLAYYVENDWKHACEKCIELLLVEGTAHTLIIHSTDEEVINLFALKKPVARLLVNTPGVFGGIGATTGLFPAMTLGSGLTGCGITSDNVSPAHLTYRRRLAYGVSDAECPEESDTGARPAAGEPEMTELVRRALHTVLDEMQQARSGSNPQRGDA